jgi:5'-nucleotidase
MKQMKKLLSVLLAVLMVFSLMSTALAVGAEDSLEGKVVILHSNDVHGAIEGYAKIAALRDQYKAAGAEVILADVGDYCQGSTYVSLSKGANAIEMMNTAGYDVATLGNHEFDYGYENLMTILKDAKYKTVCGDVIKDGKSILDGWTIIEKAGVKIGFVGLETPETYTKVNPGLIQGISFPQKEELYKCAQTLVDEVKAAGADIVVGLFHLGVDDESIGNRSTDVYANVKGLDIILDGHSHTVMTEGANKEPIQSTGTKFANVGVVVIDPASKKIESNCLVAADDITVPEDNAVLAKAKEIEKKVDDEYGAVFAKSEVELNGDKAPNGNRDSETNLGDLITDAMVWSVLKDTELKVPAENVVGITNGGGIRAWIHKGNVTMKDINTVLPFGNTVAVIYVTGAELLEALEASCFMVPGAVGGFPQVSGLEYTVNTDKEFDQGDQYPDSTYFGPKSIQRVTIDSVNGFGFDEEATYAVVTNNFCAAGGDTYYAFKAASDQFDTSIPMDEALMNYVKEVLGGVIGEEYAEPQGRIFIGTTEEIETRDLNNEAAFLKNYIEANKDAYTPETYKAFEEACAAYDKAETNADRAKALDAMKDAAKALAFKPHEYKDVDAKKWYDPAVTAVNALGLMNGVGDKQFAPDENMNRAMVATVLYRMVGSPDVTGVKCPFTDLKAGSYYENAVIWAYDAGVVKGVTETTFCPTDPISREQMATMMARFLFGSISEDDAAKADARKELKEVYSDADAIANFAVVSVGICTDIGMMQGASGAFAPKESLTRAQCAQILANLYNADIEILTAKDEAPAEETPAEETPAQAQALFFLPAA